jgi:hypothetical protein
MASCVCCCLPAALLPVACWPPQHHPIFLERLGQLDGKRMEREGANDDIILAYHLREMEFMSQVRRAAGQQLGSGCNSCGCWSGSWQPGPAVA